MSLKEAAAREACLKALLDEVDAAYKEARAEVQQLLDEAAQETGTRQVAASLPDGQQVATVSLVNGEAKARFTDEAAFTAWVREHFPSEIKREFVTSVHAAFTAKVLKEMTAAGHPTVVDTATGVVHEDVPGVEIAPARARGHSVRFAKDGRAAVAEAWRGGQLGVDALPQIAAGGAA